MHLHDAGLSENLFPLGEQLAAKIRADAGDRVPVLFPAVVATGINNHARLRERHRLVGRALFLERNGSVHIVGVASGDEVDLAVKTAAGDHGPKHLIGLEGSMSSSTTTVIAPISAGYCEAITPAFFACPEYICSSEITLNSPPLPV